MCAKTLKNRHILVVDDEPLVCQTVCMLLEAEGHLVDTAGSGTEGLSMFEPGKFDIIFTDHFMPVMKGDEFAAAIKSRAPAQPIAMLTAYPERLYPFKATPAGADLLISKPFELSDLRAAVAHLLTM